MCLGLEDIMLGEENQTEKDKFCDLTYLWTLKTKPKTNKKNNPSSQIERTDCWLPELGVQMGKMDEVGQRLQTSSYKIISNGDAAAW